eukprot:TRINITY_DN9472_c0_g1_i2.p1 TRINITY_DN9472_c0_g1~~TRINITY_DN9472_c0_g1_i2.p1  ORF type:complete len:207 (-),score=-0.21 TRINITY_DN9472_c0_g1_i2:308-928(-)
MQSFQTCTIQSKTCCFCTNKSVRKQFCQRKVTRKQFKRSKFLCQSDAEVQPNPEESQTQQGSPKQIALRNPWFSVGSVFIIATFLKITCMTWLNFGEMFFTIGYLIPVGPWTPLVMAPIGVGLAYLADYLIKQKIHERAVSLWGVILLSLAFLFVTNKLFARPRHQPFLPNYVMQRRAFLQEQAKVRQEMQEKQWSTAAQEQPAAS